MGEGLDMSSLFAALRRPDVGDGGAPYTVGCCWSSGWVPSSVSRLDAAVAVVAVVAATGAGGGAVGAGVGDVAGSAWPSRLSPLVRSCSVRALFSVLEVVGALASWL